MYQSIGLSLLPMVAKSLRLSLYMQEIKGGSVIVGGTFAERRGRRDIEFDENQTEKKADAQRDETEDLEDLLITVKVYDIHYGFFLSFSLAYTFTIAASPP